MWEIFSWHCQKKKDFCYFYNILMFLCLLQNELCRYMHMDIVLLESYPTKISEWGQVRKCLRWIRRIFCPKKHSVPHSYAHILNTCWMKLHRKALRLRDRDMVGIKPTSWQGCKYSASSHSAQTPQDVMKYSLDTKTKYIHSLFTSFEERIS